MVSIMFTFLILVDWQYRCNKVIDFTTPYMALMDSSHMCIIGRKPVFGDSDKAKLEAAFPKASLGIQVIENCYILLAANSKATGQTARLP